MGLIVISLLTGAALGMAKLIPESWLRHLDKSITITLFAMLFALGAQIGSNSELVANLPVLGWRALVIAGLSIIGSVLSLWLLTSHWTALKEGKRLN